MVFLSCKKAFEAKFDLAPLLNDFLIIFLCKFSSSIDEKCFKQSVELVYSVQGAEDKNQTRLLYCIHATFPNFFDTYRILSPLKDRIRPINFESFEYHYMNNTELYKIETFIEDLGLLNKHFSAFRREFDKMKNYFVFVNIFCFKKKVSSKLTQFTMHLAPVEEKFLTLIVLLFAKLLKESCFPLLQSFTILLSFFSNVFTSFDKKLLSFLGGIPKEELFRYTNQEMRKIGVILLTNNMPRSSSFFFYRPRKESRRIKFFTYFDCCKRLASLKANKKGAGPEFNEELNRCKHFLNNSDRNTCLSERIQIF
jgi:hypothetical protein